MHNLQEKNIIKTSFQIQNLFQQIDKESLKKEILQGLQQKHKSIAPKFFYNARGSELFEAITHLKEYYPTRAEKSIIAELYSKLNFDFTDANIIELGSGDASKISLLLEQIPIEILKTIRYFPIDISAAAIEKSAKKLQDAYPLKSINGIVADFFKQLDFIPEKGKNFICFFGSTIGNFNPVEQQYFLQALSSQMKNDDVLLLGLDTVKNNDILENAYNDEAGVTADFNKNILLVINELIEANFNLEDFEHFAFYNQQEKRIEMHLKALKDVEISISNYNQPIYIKKGESIHTENSYKFSLNDLNTLAESSSLKVVNLFNATENLFSLAVLKKI